MCQLHSFLVYLGIFIIGIIPEFLKLIDLQLAMAIGQGKIEIESLYGSISSIFQFDWHDKLYHRPTYTRTSQ